MCPRTAASRRDCAEHGRPERVVACGTVPEVSGQSASAMGQSLELGRIGPANRQNRPAQQSLNRKLPMQSRCRTAPARGWTHWRRPTIGPRTRAKDSPARCGPSPRLTASGSTVCRWRRAAACSRQADKAPARAQPGAGAQAPAHAPAGGDHPGGTGTASRACAGGPQAGCPPGAGRLKLVDRND